MGLENSTCDRCENKVSTLKGSFFNTEMICKSCEEKESNHKLYTLAVEEERKQVIKRNYDFEGIGLPDDLK